MDDHTDAMRNTNQSPGATPIRPGQDVIAWCANKAIDDPDSSDEYQNCDSTTAMYEGNGQLQ